MVRVLKSVGLANFILALVIEGAYVVYGLIARLPIDDPVRNGTLPRNIVDVARAIMGVARPASSDTLREQLDYALRLVSWSWIARQCGVQIDLLDVLIDAGAPTDGAPDNALVNGNVAAAEHLVTRGAALTLSTALCLGRWEDASRLAGSATSRNKQFALTLAALRGNAEALRRIIDMGVDVNAVSPDLYSHAPPLHHAVYSGSLEAVRVLVEAGANLSARDTAHDATPIGWAEYSKGKQPYDEIAAYLRHRAGGSG
jgi:peptide-methionine (S)-S-oxide reductase